MHIDLRGRTLTRLGATNPISDAVAAALAEDGAMSAAPGAAHPDILLVSFPLVPTADVGGEALLAAARQTASAMAEGTGGRILFLLSAIAALPARRHPEYSAAMAGVLAGLRAIAMAHGPKVLANAVGVGAIGEPLIAGDAAFVGHTGLGRAGSIADVVAAAKFLCDPFNSYTTGQMLSVDGGWSAGYGRSF